MTRHWRDIKIDTPGIIKNGDDTGWFVRILDDSQNTGGYLILTSENKDFTSGFDGWVQNKEDLEGYIKEANWIIEWLE